VDANSDHSRSDRVSTSRRSLARAGNRGGDGLPRIVAQCAADQRHFQREIALALRVITHLQAVVLIAEWVDYRRGIRELAEGVLVAAV
jgi:uncharacterized protein YjiS (DUF1127 family)